MGVSILLESYCNTLATQQNLNQTYGFNSPRVLLQHS
ncbi:hypothetical protein BD01_0769 [Thermococcus nautili]|uniref:Uncharacterized protein n=1 Tax=Thermococcus nautili TaxID=195522 RepID=W8P0Y9_9EURY|nr:hypothetical protein BD01_0769 [Thermococcus nautili]